MGGNASLPKEPLYVSTCACGKVEVELRGEPLHSHLCYCDDCTTAANFVEEKAAEKGHKNIPTFQDGEKAPKCYLFYIGHMRVTKGENMMEIVKCKPKGFVSRPFTTCCSTAIVLCGGKWPMNFRPMNGYTIKDARTGKPLELTCPRIMCKCANKEHLKSAPKGLAEYALAPWALLWLFFSRALFKVFFQGEGELGKKPVAWINGDAKDVDTLVPISAYHRMGHKLDKKEPAAKKIE